MFYSDFVAYTDGKNNILQLRNIILDFPRRFIPKSISFKYINIGGDFWHIRIYDYVLKKKFEVYGGPRVSIYEYFPFLTFHRFRRREYGSFQLFLNKVILNEVYLMHCVIKPDFSYFLRSERSNWRETGNYIKYPTLISYIKDIIKEKYNTANFKKAMKIFLKNEVYNKEYYIKYDPNKYLPYPTLILEEMKKDNVFKINNLI